MSTDERRIAFLADYLPRKCGIATFTSDLLAAAARWRDDENADMRVKSSLMLGLGETEEEVVGVLGEMRGPTKVGWWMAGVEKSDTGAVIGDLGVRLSWEGRCAEIRGIPRTSGSRPAGRG